MGHPTLDRIVAAAVGRDGDRGVRLETNFRADFRPRSRPVGITRLTMPKA
jgi:hypothetical protein